MSADGYIGAAEFGQLDDSFNNVDWLTSICYNPPSNEPTYGIRDIPSTEIHDMQEKISKASTTIQLVL